MEALLENSSCGLAEQDSTHVDLHNLPRDSILLDAVANVVELCERGAELVEVVAEGVGEKIVQDSHYDLRESDHALGEFQLLFVRHIDFSIQSCSFDLVTGNISQSCNRPETR